MGLSFSIWFQVVSSSVYFNWLIDVSRRQDIAVPIGRTYTYHQVISLIALESGAFFRSLQFAIAPSQVATYVGP